MRNHERPRILITRLSAIGDCVHTMPLVSALRERLPKAFIAWVVQPAGASLLEGYPGLDERIVVNRDWMKNWSGILAVRRELQRHRFDIVVDPQSLTKSALLGWLSGARLRIGFAKPQGREFSGYLNNRHVTAQQSHVVDRYRELLQPILGESLPPVRFELPERLLPTSQQIVTRAGGAGRYAVLNPGAGWQSKTWLPTRFGHVAQHLRDRFEIKSVAVWAGDEEHAWAQQIVDSSHGAALLAPATSLPELAEVLRHARLCVAGDTGPLHLAVAVNTPCVGLYGTTQPEVCGPYLLASDTSASASPPHRTVQAYYQHYDSSRERRSAANDAMAAITVEMVVGACDQLLATTPPGQVA